MTDIERIIEIIGEKLADETRRSNLFHSQGREGMSERADGAACALRDVLNTLVDRYDFTNTMESKIPPRLREWSDHGGRSYVWLPPQEPLE